MVAPHVSRLTIDQNLYCIILKPLTIQEIPVVLTEPKTNQHEYQFVQCFTSHA